MQCTRGWIHGHVAHLCSHMGLPTYLMLCCCPSFLFCTGPWKFCSQSWAYQVHFKSVFLEFQVYDTFNFKFWNRGFTWSWKPKMVIMVVSRERSLRLFSYLIPDSPLLAAGPGGLFKHGQIWWKVELISGRLSHHNSCLRQNEKKYF